MNKNSKRLSSSEIENLREGRRIIFRSRLLGLALLAIGSAAALPKIEWIGKLDNLLFRVIVASILITVYFFFGTIWEFCTSPKEIYKNNQADKNIMIAIALFSLIIGFIISVIGYGLLNVWFNAV